MTSGVVTGDRQAVIHLTVRGPTGQDQEIEAIIDTGVGLILARARPSAFGGRERERFRYI
jgi:hypothetical protein